MRRMGRSEGGWSPRKTRNTRKEEAEKASEERPRNTRKARKGRGRAEWFSFRVVRGFRGQLRFGRSGWLVGDEGGDAGAEFEFDFEFHREAARVVLCDPDADGGTAFEHPFGRGFVHARLKDEGLERAEAGGDLLVADRVDGELVGILIKKHERIALFAGLEIPLTGGDEAHDEVERIAGRERHVEVSFGFDLVAVERETSGVVERGAVPGLLFLGRGRFDVGHEAASRGLDEGLGAGVEGVERAGKAAGCSGRNVEDAVGRNGGRGRLGEDLDFAGREEKAPAHAIGECFAGEEGGLGGGG